MITTISVGNCHLEDIEYLIEGIKNKIEEKMKKKMDHRVKYTLNALKEAMIELLQENILVKFRRFFM